MIRCYTSILQCLAVILLSALPKFALCQSSPTPQLVTIPSPPPVDQPFEADAYFFGSTPPGSFSISTAANVITAQYYTECPSACPGNIYGLHRLQLPALQSGSYTLKIVDPNNSAHLFAQFPLVIGSPDQSNPPPQLATIPSPPLAGEPFVANAYFVPPQGPVPGILESDVTVDGNVITDYLEFGCPFECPGGTLFDAYGPWGMQLPALQPGIYTLKIVRLDSPTTIYAQFQFAVGARIDPTPAYQPLVLWFLIALMLVPGCLTLRRGLATSRRASAR
jgi:hypothetical protein